VIFEFFSWLLMLYLIHRAAHKFPWLKRFHLDHHAIIAKAMKEDGIQGWHWNNLLLYNDTNESTIDLWLTEVIPTAIFSLLVGHWWFFLLYYVWAAFFQETLEHKSDFNIPGFTAGEWHLLHHKYPTTNFSLFIPFWDIVFRTNK
jgi:sterol desaturase/sphingolipid hydroxylase (fatty acid hydroxylase superfamily)